MKKLMLVWLCLFATSCQKNTEYQEDKIIFRYGCRFEFPDSKNVYTSRMNASRIVYHQNIYEPLLALDEFFNWDPVLAKSWYRDEDEKTWYIHLKENIYWHDGKKFTADDVVFSYRCIMDHKLIRLYNDVSDLESVKKMNQYTVQIVTKDKKANMISALNIPIVPKHIWSVNEHTSDFMNFLNSEPIGTGPLKYANEKNNEYVRFVANENYWGGKPKFDEFIFVFYANYDTLIQAFEAGHVDMIEVMEGSQRNYLKNLKHIAIHEYSNLRFKELGFNMWDSEESRGNPLIRDYPEIRKAIDHAIDYEKIISFRLGGMGNRETSIILQNMTAWAWNAEKSPLFRENNPELAQQLLESIGFNKINEKGIRENNAGQLLSFRFTVIESDYKDEALIIQKNCKDIGIDLQIQYVDVGRQRDIIYNQNFDTDMYIWGWGCDYYDPNMILSVMTTQEIGKKSDCFYSNAEYDALYYTQRKTIDKSARRKMIARMQEILYEDAPYLILYSHHVALAYDESKWKNFVEWPYKDGSIMFNRKSMLRFEPVEP